MRRPRDHSVLEPGELYWRDHYDWLQQRGYMLRPRYKPDWIPSWTGTNKLPLLCEDGQGALVSTQCFSLRPAVHYRVEASGHGCDTR